MKREDLNEAIHIILLHPSVVRRDMKEQCDHFDGVKTRLELPRKDIAIPDLELELTLS